MTINTNYQQESYISNGTLLDYDFDFPAFEDTDLRVYVKDTSDNVVLQTLNSDYTVAFNDDKTGTITFDTAPTINYTIYIRRDTAQTQSTAYKTSSGFQALVVENDFDKGIAISQEITEIIDRQLYTSPFSDEDVNAELPIPVDTKCLKWEYDSGTDSYSLVNSTYDPDTYAADAEAQAVIATTQASIATTQANLSSGYATQSMVYRDEAEDFKDEAAAAAATINGDPLWNATKTFIKGDITTVIVSDIPYKYYNLTGTNTATSPQSDSTNWALWIFDTIETASCSTAKSTAAKTATITNFVLVAGMTFKLKFANGNSAQDITLNINSLGAKPIADESGNAASATYPFLVKSGTTVEFTYDGTNFVYTNKVVKSYKSTNDWYRIWSNGFIEQGSLVSSTSNQVTTVTLLVAFVDVYYNVKRTNVTTNNTTGTVAQFRPNCVHDIGTTSFTAYTSDVGLGYYWSASGF